VEVPRNACVNKIVNASIQNAQKRAKVAQLACVEEIVIQKVQKHVDESSLRHGPGTRHSLWQGFESLVQGSKHYYVTAMVKLFTHPCHTMDNATFERQYECWSTNMCTSKCDDMKPVPDRKKDSAKLRTSTNYDWLKIWKFFSDDEIKWLKKPYLSEEVESEDTDGEAG